MINTTNLINQADKVSAKLFSSYVGEEFSDAGMAKLRNAIRARIGQVNATVSRRGKIGTGKVTGGVFKVTGSQPFNLETKADVVVCANILCGQILAAHKADTTEREDGISTETKVTVSAGLRAWLVEKFADVPAAPAAPAAPATVSLIPSTVPA